MTEIQITKTRYDLEERTSVETCVGADLVNNQLPNHNNQIITNNQIINNQTGE